MSEFTQYNGEHLLDVFKELNINLGDLHPNVVRAWFDTDDKDMIDLLSFMCSSLSRENIVSAQELSEFECLEKPLHDSQLENAFIKTEAKNPGIFNYALNSTLLKISLDELELLEQEEQRLDELEKMEELLQQSLSRNKSKIEQQSLTLDCKCEEASSRCEELGNELEEKTQNLHEKLTRNLFALANFQCGETSDFLNGRDLDEIYDSAEFHKIIKDMVQKQHDELSGYFSLSNINLNSTPNEENCEDKLQILQNQIFSSYMEYLETRMEAESLAGVHNFLENFFTYDFLSDCNSSSISESLERKKMLFSKLHKKAIVIAEEPINLIKIKKLQSELQDMEDNLDCFSQISKYYSKLLCTTSCALMLLLREKKSVDEVEQSILYISRYILHNLEDSKDRQGLMLKVINNFNDYSQKPLEQRNQLLSIIVDSLGATTLKEAYSNYCKLNSDLKALEQKHFSDNISELAEKLYKTDISRQFLTSGLTKTIVAIPSPVLKSLRNIRSNLDKQNAALKFLLYISNQTLTKLSEDKWLKNFRLIWIYFLVAPKKLKELLAQMDQDLKSKEVKTVRFKENLVNT